MEKWRAGENENEIYYKGEKMKYYKLEAGVRVFEPDPVTEEREKEDEEIPFTD